MKKSNSLNNLEDFFDNLSVISSSSILITTFKNLLELKKGGFGKVYIGKHVLDSKRYAIKKIPILVNKKNILKAQYFWGAIEVSLIEQKMHQVYKIPLYRESDLNRLRWLGGLAIILGAILRSSGFPEEFDFAVTIIGITCFTVVSYFEKDKVYLTVFSVTLIILTAGLIHILSNI